MVVLKNKGNFKYFANAYTVEPRLLELPREIEITSSYRGFEV